MELHFKSRKLEAACSSERESVRAWGEENARVVRRRLTQLAAAVNLAMIETVPPARLHPLSGNRKGQWAIDIKHPHRLILEPWHEDIPLLNDGGVDKARVTAIRILAVENYHGR